MAKSPTGPCYSAPVFILLAFHYFVAVIERKIHPETGSHNDSKIYTAMSRIDKVHAFYQKIHIDAYYKLLASSCDCIYGFSPMENITEC